MRSVWMAGPHPQDMHALDLETVQEFYELKKLVTYEGTWRLYFLTNAPKAKRQQKYMHQPGIEPGGRVLFYH